MTRPIVTLLLMMIGPFAFWYMIFILIMADWNIANWHIAARIVWVVLSMYSMFKILKRKIDE